MKLFMANQKSDGLVYPSKWKIIWLMQMILINGFLLVNHRRTYFFQQNKEESFPTTVWRMDGHCQWKTWSALTLNLNALALKDVSLVYHNIEFNSLKYDIWSKVILYDYLG